MPCISVPVSLLPLYLLISGVCKFSFVCSLAWVEMRLILGRLLWNFDLALAPECSHWIERQKVFQVWEKTPLMVRIKKRRDLP